MHSILYFRLKHVNASRCILMSILSPREQRERSKLMVTDTRRSEAVLNFLQDCNAVRLRESQIIRHHHNRIHIGLLTKKNLCWDFTLPNEFYCSFRLRSAEDILFRTTFVVRPGSPLGSVYLIGSFQTF